jgi:multisubunit Na+/H+ antiporter MnhB subunit
MLITLLVISLLLLIFLIKNNNKTTHFYLISVIITIIFITFSLIINQVTYYGTITTYVITENNKKCHRQDTFGLCIVPNRYYYIERYNNE